MDLFLRQEPTKIKVEGINLTYEGLVPKIQKSMLSKDVEAMQPHIRAFVERAVTFAACPDCGGTRLSRRGPVVQDPAGSTSPTLCAMQISDLADWVARAGRAVGGAAAGRPAAHCSTRSCEIGLGYLSLDRPSGTLSGGEAQRTKMIRHLGSSLTDVTYVFDEPTIGLHPHDIQRMNELLLQLRDKGNTVLVVEHKPEAIAIADHVVDLGPGAGAPAAARSASRAASRAARQRHGHRPAPRRPGRRSSRRCATPSGALEMRGATTAQPARRRRRHPARRAGRRDRGGGLGQELADPRLGRRPRRRGRPSTRRAIRGSRRSNPATYTGLLDPIRKAFAKANGVKPALFSANSDGACPTCNGAGVIYTDLGMMASVATTCEECEGKRFQAAVLEYHAGRQEHRRGAGHAGGRGHGVLRRRRGPHAGRPHDPGAGWPTSGSATCTLGQPLTTLSGGERQRLKLATQMAEKGAVYVLDEPTTGLHLADVEQLLGLLDRLVDSGKSVIVIEHHQAVMAHADWIIDLGPGAGHDGGRVVFEGTPADLVAGRSTLTGEHLAAYVGA